MATQVRGVTQTVHEDYVEQSLPSRPKTTQRKSSFSEALNKFTSNTFNRRRTDIGIPSSTSSISINHHSRIPTPAGIDRSTSFFSTLNTFASKSTASVSEESPQPSHTNRCRRISERLAQTPFFSHQHQQQPTSTPRKSREPSIKIEQRGLMQPVHPPLPHSNTIGNLVQSQQSSSHTPSFMRPTTSSARRSSIMGRSNTVAPGSMTGRGSAALQRQRNSSLRTIAGSSTPSKITTQTRQVQASKFPVRSDSLASAPSTTNEIATAFETEISPTLPDMPTDYSDGANFRVTNKPAQEMPETNNSSNGKPKTATAHMHQNRRAAPVLESKKSNLSTKGTNRKLSEGLSNLYVNDEAHVRKEEHDSDEIKSHSDQGSPDYSERTATPESSNPRLVMISPTALYPLALPPPAFILKTPSPHIFSRLMHHRRQVHEAQPPMYWLGRYTALSDRFRTGALPSPPPSPHSSTNDYDSTNEPFTTSLSPGSSSNANHPMHDTDRRNRRVYIHLRSLCTTDEARASLEEFKKVMEAREKKMAGPQGKGVKEKQGWLEGLMGKKKKG